MRNGGLSLIKEAIAMSIVKYVQDRMKKRFISKPLLCFLFVPLVLSLVACDEYIPIQDAEYAPYLVEAVGFAEEVAEKSECYEDSIEPPPFIVVPRAEWSEFYSDEFCLNQNEYIENLFESARSVTTFFENSAFTTIHSIEPYEHELVEPWLELPEEIIINGDVIDAPAPIWKHLTLGNRFIGHYHGAMVSVEVLLPVMMIPLREVAEALGFEVTWDVESGEIMLGDSYRLQLGKREYYWTGIEQQFFMSAEPIIYNEMIFIPASFFQHHGAQVFDSQLVIGPYSLNRSGEVVIGITLATDESLASYDSFAEFLDFTREAPLFKQIIIVPNMPLYDFRWFEVGQGVDDFYFYNIDIHKVGEISPEQPFLVSWHPRGTFPHRGISFVDYNGVTRFFSLSTNEASFDENPRGMYILIEFLPGVPFQ